MSARVGYAPSGAQGALLHLTQLHYLRRFVPARAR